MNPLTKLPLLASCLLLGLSVIFASAAPTSEDIETMHLKLQDGFMALKKNEDCEHLFDILKTIGSTGIISKGRVGDGEAVGIVLASIYRQSSPSKQPTREEFDKMYDEYIEKPCKHVINLYTEFEGYIDHILAYGSPQDFEKVSIARVAEKAGEFCTVATNEGSRDVGFNEIKQELRDLAE